jgi:integrase
MYHPLIHLAVYTGMRRSELLGLRWRDVDLDMATLSITQVMHHLNDGRIIFQEPKSQKGKRQIALSPSAVLALRDHKQQQELGRLLTGVPLKPDDLVFSHPDGSPLLPNSVTHAFIKVIRRAGLNGIRLHDLRHTHATLMLRQGIHPKIVQERLGHATISITLDTYSHVTPGLQQAAALRFEEGLLKPAPVGAE